MILRKNEDKLTFNFDKEGRIISQEKHCYGLPEYEMELSKYSVHQKEGIPKKLKITDFSDSNQLTLVFNQIQRPNFFKQPLTFIPPEGMKIFIPSS